MSIFKRVFQRKPSHGSAKFGVRNSISARAVEMAADEIVDIVRAACCTEALTVDDHERATQIAERYRFSFYDSLIIATALRAGCQTLYSEDLQHSQKIERQLTVFNPFVKG